MCEIRRISGPRGARKRPFSQLSGAIGNEAAATWADAIISIGKLAARRNRALSYEPSDYS